jgi:hypothetical protein
MGRNRQPTAGPQYARDLAKDCRLVGSQIDDAMADHTLERGVGQRQLVDGRFVELSTFEDPAFAALVRAKASISGAKSMPMARPDRPAFVAQHQTQGNSDLCNRVFNASGNSERLRTNDISCHAHDE